MNYTLETFYHSKEWAKFRELVIAEKLAKYGELIDEETGKTILNKGDAILHHKTFLTAQNVNDPSVSLNPQNIELVSFATHQLIHNKFGCRGRKVYITRKKKEEIKKESLEEFDLQIDFETLKNALGGKEGTKSNTWAIYYALIDQVNTRLGKWTKALIFARGTVGDFERLKKKLGAEEF